VPFISVLKSFNVIVDTRLEARARAAYLPAMPMNYGPAGAGEQSITPREVLSEIANTLGAALGRVEALIRVSPEAEGIGRFIEAIRRDLDHARHEHPRVEKERIEELEDRLREREAILEESPAATMPPSQPDSPRQTRLRAVLATQRSHLILDGTPIPAQEVGVYYMDALIRANGEGVSFAGWVAKTPRFAGAVSTRVLDQLPEEIQGYIQRDGKGRPPRLKVELLQSAQ
jgi:hypothetical protein